MGIKEKRVTFDEVRKVFNKWLELPDRDILDVAAGAVVANLFKHNPVWLFLIAPPGGLKSEIINSMSQAHFTYPVSDLTPQSFVSGRGKSASFLPKMTDHTLTLKDFTTVLSKRYESMNEILAQMREIYDGKFSKIFGTGEEVSWEGHIGLLAGCTEVIDIKRDIHTILGERFILYRLPIGDRMKVGRKALGNVNDVKKMRAALARVMKNFFHQYLDDEPKVPTISPKIKDTLVVLADITAYGRVNVPRERNTKIIEQVLLPESPARLVQAYALLAQGIASLNGRNKVGEEELRIIRKVAADTMIKSRRQLLEILYREEGKISTSKMSDKVTVPTVTTSRHLEDMWVLKCVERELEQGETVKVGGRILSTGKGQKYVWNLTNAWAKKLKRVRLFD